MFPLVVLAPAFIAAMASMPITQIPESITLEGLGSISAQLTAIRTVPRDAEPWKRLRIIGPKNYGKRDASFRSRSNRRKR